APAAFGRRCVPAGCVAPRSNTPGILARRALPSGRIAALGATLAFRHGLLWLDRGVHVTGREHVVAVHAYDQVIHVGIDGREPVRDTRRNHNHISGTDPAALAVGD